MSEEIAETSPRLKKKNSLYIQEGQQTQRRENSKKSTPRHF